MPIGTPEGFLDITNATLRTSVVGISNTGPTGELSVGSNLHVDTTASNVLQVVGNVSSHNMTLGEISLVPAHGLENVTEVGNTTPHTVSFSNATTGLATTSNLHVGGSLKVGVIDFFNPGLTLATVTNNSNVTPYTVDLRNATTGLVTTANVIVGKDLQVAGNVSLTGSVTSNLHLASNLEVGTANLFVNPATSNVGIGTNLPLAALDVRGNLRLTSTSNAAHFAELSAGQTSNAYVKITDITGTTVNTVDDYFGWSVAVSGDGSTLAVVASEDDDAGTNRGALYIFKKNSVGEWQQRQKNTEVTTAGSLTSSGYSGALSMSRDGSTIVAGKNNADPGGIADAGAAYIYKLVGGSYVYQQEITASDKAVDDHFGRSVAISSDGTTIIVGSNHDDDGASTQGSAYIFDWNGSTWSQTQNIVQSDALASGAFGHGVAISDDGTVAAVGAGYHDSQGTDDGAVYIFTKSGGTWSQTQKMYASDYASQASQYLGLNISMAGDGSMVVAGAPYSDTGGTDAGATYIFVKSGGVWPVTETQKIVASDAAADDRFGYTVATSQNGDRIIVAATYEDTNNSNKGKIYVFDRSNGTWTETRNHDNPHSANSSHIGWSTAVSSGGGVYLAGIPFEDFGAGTSDDYGSVRIFEDEVWRERSNTFTVNAGILSKNPVIFKVLCDKGHQAATQIIKWNRITINVGGGYDHTTGLFTAPISGFYHFSFWGMGLYNASSTRVEWRKNGIPYPGPVGHQGLLYSDPQYSMYSPMVASNTIDLDAGETVGLWITNNTFHAQYNGFSGFYISS